MIHIHSRSIVDHLIQWQPNGLHEPPGDLTRTSFGTCDHFRGQNPLRGATSPPVGLHAVVGRLVTRPIQCDIGYAYFMMIGKKIDCKCSGVQC
jgi:hypothetical protein